MGPLWPETASIIASASFSRSEAHVGDTLTYQVKVEWLEPGPEIAIAAPENLEFSGFTVLERNTAFHKTAGGESVRNRMEFLYHLRADEPGQGVASAARVPYTAAGDSRHLPLPSASVPLSPPHISLFDRPGFRYAALGAALSLVIVGGIGVRKKLRQKKSLDNREGPPTWPEELDLLKNRLPVAESKSLLEEMEALSLRFLRTEIKRLAGSKGARLSSGSEIDEAGFDSLLPRYLELMGDSEAESWKKLGDLFRYARYAGGQKERHELATGYGWLKTCMRVDEDVEMEREA